MTMADPHRNNPESPYCRPLADPLDYFEGSILAYLLRRKPGVPRAIDLRKARHYLDKCIAREEAKGG